MRIALYARVSTRDKDQNPETQLMRLQVARALEKLHHGIGKRKAIITRPGTFEIRASGDLRVLWQYAGMGQIQVQAVVDHNGI